MIELTLFKCHTSFNTLYVVGSISPLILWVFKCDRFNTLYVVGSRGNKMYKITLETSFNTLYVVGSKDL